MQLLHHGFIAAAATAPLIALAIDNVRLRKQVRAARRDPLTGLLRREAWTSPARKLAAHSDAVAVLIDANDFKLLNDEHGHAAGDAVLAALGQRLLAWVKTNQGTAVRLGGDEFAAIARIPHGRRHHVGLLHALPTQPVEHDGQSLPVSASIGATPTTGRPLPDALRDADDAMYKAKRTNGKLHFAYPDPTANRIVNGRRFGRPGTHMPARWAAAAGGAS